jgi:hypothetical protein
MRRRRGAGSQRRGASVTLSAARSGASSRGSNGARRPRVHRGASAPGAARASLEREPYRGAASAPPVSRASTESARQSREVHHPEEEQHWGDRDPPRRSRKDQDDGAPRLDREQKNAVRPTSAEAPRAGPRLRFRDGVPPLILGAARPRRISDRPAVARAWVGARSSGRRRPSRVAEPWRGCPGCIGPVRSTLWAPLTISGSRASLPRVTSQS